MFKLLSITSTLLLLATGTAMAQQAGNPQVKLDKLLREANQVSANPVFRMQAAQPKLSTPASIMDYLFPARPMGAASPMTARQAAPQRASGVQLPSDISADADAQQRKTSAPASAMPMITPDAQGPEPVAPPTKTAANKK